MSFSKHILALIFIIFIASCSQRSNTVVQSTGDCLQANVSVASLITGIKVGVPVSMRVQASGCDATTYRATRGTTTSITFTSSGLFNVTYEQPATGYIESVKVEALNASGGVIDSGVFSTTAFNILNATSFTCSATPNMATASVAVSSSGVVTPVDFVFSINSSYSANLNEVKNGSSVVSGLGLPKVVNKQLSLTVPVNTVGQQVFTFTLYGAGSEVSSSAYTTCSATVTTTAQQPNLPQITSFSASNPQPNVGSAITLSLNVTNATSATIDEVGVNLSGGSASRSVTPPNTGTRTYTATATNSGGTVSQSINVVVNPLCEISSTQSSATVGSAYPIRVKISGGFLGASMAVSGLTTLSVPPNAAGLDQIFNLNVLQATGAQTGTLTVLGPNSTSATCSLPLNLVAGTPVISLMINNGSATTVNVYVRTNVVFSWSFQNVTCYDYLNRPLAMSGNFTHNDIRSDQKFLVNCQLQNGTWQSKDITAHVLARWFQANLYVCPDYCAAIGLTNVMDLQQGMACASGEQRPLSLSQQDYFQPGYDYGCPNNICSPISGNSNSISYGSYCYSSGQTQNNQTTDRTVACYCR